MPRIIVIGAGIAGLSAAEHLSNNGFHDVVVLEASDRTGGRICTKQFGHSQKDIIEIGANWIHGPALNNSVFTLVNQAGLMKEWRPLDRMKGFCYTSDGKGIEKPLTDKLWSLYQQWEAELPVFDRDNLDKRYTMRQHMAKRFNEEIGQFPESSWDDLRCVLNCLNNYEQFHHGGDIGDVPMPSLIKTRIPGGNVQVMEGLSSVCGYLVKRLPLNTIKFNSPVNHIDNSSENEVVVRCNNGMIYRAEHVIVTVSVGVLKANHQQLFTPPLPMSKTQAINTIKFGNVAKVFLEWERPFWREETGSIKFCWSDEEIASAHREKHWYRKIFSFDEVMNNRHVLVGWLSGYEAKYMETLPDDEIIDTCTKLIRQFLKDPSIPAPVKVTRSTFNTNPLFLGTYVYVDFKTRQETFDNYAAPVCDSTGLPRLQFAGEATIDWCYSTMHGGRISGVREAQRLIDLYHSTTSKL